MATAKFCPDCGAPLLADSPQGICPRCAFNVALGYPGRGASEPTTSHAVRSFGRFHPPKPDELAQHFPQLEILDLIGQGGMGAVYKARQKGLDRIVALKILPPTAAQDPAFGERFRREARALAKLSHPNIVSVYDSGEAGGLYYFLMEYVDGVNMRQAIQAGSVEPKAALAIVPQICDALQYAHDVGVVHRDIKPENILLDAKGRVKIADFGLARLLGNTGDTFTLTGTHQVMGTPRYMAPEQLEGTHEVDHRADIYSLGVVFYEMLTRELPIGRFAPPSRKVQLDVRLDEVVLRTLEKEPSHRYQHANDLKTAVETITGGTNIPVHLRRMYGYEYRSKAEILGFPIVHIATGIDPVTHRRRVAKGVIAIGDQAIGVFAFGGSAIGLIAFGGIAFGAVSIGGLSIGLLLALGGGAIGLGLAIGGMAVAPVALGGCAVGYYAMGGAAFGFHATGGNARDPLAQAFFRDWAGPAMRLMTASGVFIPLSIFVVWILAAVALRRPEEQNADQKQLRADLPPHHKTRHASAVVTGCTVFAVTALLCGLPVIVIGLLMGLAYFRAESSVAANAQVAEVQKAMATQHSIEAQAAYRAYQTGIEWTADGPKLADRVHAQLQGVRGELQIDNLIHERLTDALRETFREYQAVEAKYKTRTGPEGRGDFVVSVPKHEIAKLEDKLWSQIDQELNTRQQAVLRSSLRLTPPDKSELTPGASIDDTLTPGVLGWGAKGVDIQVGKKGSWYAWSIQSQGDETTGSSPEPPPQFRRFWDTAEKQ